MELRLEYRRASELKRNPKNWRKHPPRQRQIIEKLLSETGWAGAVLYNETTGQLIDGHLRADLSGESVIPVLIGSWTIEQEQLLIASLDPVTALAQTEHAALELLLSQIDSEIPKIIFDGQYDFQTIDEPIEIEIDKITNEKEQQKQKCPRCGYEF